MDTVQELLEQPIILVVLAGLIILTAVVLFVAPTLSRMVGRLKAAAPKEVKSEKKTTLAPPPKAKTPPKKRLNIRLIAQIVISVLVIAVFVIGGWYTYTTFFKKPLQPTKVSQPNYEYEYSILGSVKNIDYEKGTLTVYDNFTGKNYTLQKNALTKVFSDKKEVSFTEVKKYYVVSVRSNADFETEDVNIFEVDIVSPGVGP